MSHFLAPSESTILSPTTIDEWFRPIHIWNDGITQVGAPWEILKLPSSSGGTFDLYTKGGNLAGFHTQFALDRATGYGIVVLMTGEFQDASGIAATVAEEYFHPTFKAALVEAVMDKYGGTYESHHHKVHVSVTDETLWVDMLVVNGSNILENFFGEYGAEVEPVALWPTVTAGEFRCVITVCAVFLCTYGTIHSLAFGRPNINHAPHAGCEPYWITIDGAFANGAPLDLLYFEENGDLVVPAFNISLSKQ